MASVNAKMTIDYQCVAMAHREHAQITCRSWFAVI